MVVRWQATTAHGGHQWLWVVEEEVLGLGWTFGEKKKVKIMFFHAEERIYNLQISLSEWESTFGVKRDFSRLAQFLSGWDFH